MHYGLSHAQCVQWRHALPPPRPPPWRCLTLELASGELLHLAAHTDDEARDWVLGLQALRRRAAATTAAAAAPAAAELPAWLTGRAAAAAAAAAATRVQPAARFVPRTSPAFRPPFATDAGPAVGINTAATDPTACSECQLLWQRARMRLRARAHAEGRPVRSLLAAAVVKGRVEEDTHRWSSSTQGTD